MPSNTANPALGTLQSPLIVSGVNLTEIVCECAKSTTYDSVKNIPVDDWVKCCILGKKREQCVQEKIENEQKKGNGDDLHTPAGANYDSASLPAGKDYCRPDIVRGEGTKPLDASEMMKIYELKFPCNGSNEPLPSIKKWDPDKLMGGTMKKCYRDIRLPGAAKKKGGVEVEAIGPTAESCN